MPDYGAFEYGGVRFTRLVPQQEITSYVGSLADDKRGDIQQIVMSLEAAGLLDIEQMPPGISPQQEQQMGFADHPNPVDVVSKEYGTIETMSPTLAVHYGDSAGQGQEVRQEAQRLQAGLDQAQTSMYSGQPPAPPKPGSISASLRVNNGYLRNPPIPPT